MLLSFVCVCMCVYAMYVWCMQRSEEGIGSFRAVATGIFEIPLWMLVTEFRDLRRLRTTLNC